MCGVVGFLSSENQETLLAQMVQTQTHRGPDDSGYFICDEMGVHLGHNRLSIQDISEHAHQPFISDCQQYVLVFNGEVYNFNEIREELIGLGYLFISTSDTEVILYAYKEWGIDAIDRFIGMFAFSLYDREKRKLFLVRDRSGIKPLYYYADEENFLFASELKAFHVHAAFKKDINKEILPFYFQFAYIPAPHTIYNRCYKLEPGHYMEYDLVEKSYQIIKYWDINRFYLMDKFDKSEEEIVEDIEKLLIEASQYRMVSDVPVGVFLSGGYDSSIVTSLLQNHQKEPLQTFTIGFEQKEFNEANDAKKIAHYLKSEHVEQYCTKEEMLSLIDQLPFYFDEPFADDSTLPTMLVSKLARKKVTVALSADGGDEIFFGYSKYFALQQFMKIRTSKVKSRLLKIVVNLLNDKSVLRLNALLPKSKRQANIVDKFNKFKNMMNARTPQEMFIRSSSKVEADFLDEILEDGKFTAFDTTAFSGFENLKTVAYMDQMMAVDYKTFMVDDVLCKVDRATMSVSLEGREPLLDHRLAEYMARVPTELKYHQGRGKYLLREVLGKYLPREMTDKPKAGFTVPLKEWLLNELKPKALASLESPILREDAIFKEDALEEMTVSLREGEIKNATLIWMIISYVMWRERWQ
jgi:asparagine synthase (glutamine-hydrolysing)